LFKPKVRQFKQAISAAKIQKLSSVSLKRLQMKMSVIHMYRTVGGQEKGRKKIVFWRTIKDCL
jgi:hypothetical protein